VKQKRSNNLFFFVGFCCTVTAMTTQTTIPTNGLELKQIKTKDTINASKNENDDRKLFVGNLSWETTIDELKEYFQKFGEIKDATIKVDVTGRSRGFGFVLFDDSASVEKALEGEHILNERKIEPKRATAKERVKKIFVGGVSPDLPEAEIRKHFEEYGDIEEIAFPINKEKKIRKGFCFVTFKDANACELATAKGKEKQDLGGKKVDVKKAVPQEVYQEWNVLYQPYFPNYPPPGRGRGGNRGMFINRGNPRGFTRGGGGGSRGMPAAGYNNGYPPMGYEVYPGYEYSMDYYDYGYAGYPDYGVQGGYGGYGYAVPNTGKFGGGRGGGGRGRGR